MLLFLIFTAWLVASPAVHYLLSQHPLSTFRWLAQVFRNYSMDKTLMIVFWGALILHLIGTRTLGQVSYNTTGFDVLTHTMFGFIVRETMLRANDTRAFITQIRDRLPESIRGMITLTTLALAFCLTHEVQEQIQTLIPALKAGVWYTWQDQLKDMLMNTIGISISVYKDEKRLVTGVASFVVVVGLCLFLW